VPIDNKTVGTIAYPPEKLVDGDVEASLAAGSAINVPPLSLVSLQNDGVVTRFVDLALVPQAAPVSLAGAINADGVLYPSATWTLNAAQLPNGMPDPEVAVTSGRSIVFNVVNNGIAAATNTQAAWGLWIWAPTAADRRNLGLGGVSPDLAALLPAWRTPLLTPDEVIARFFPRPQKIVYAGTYNVPSGGRTRVTIAADSPPAGFFDVVAYVWVDDSVAGTINLAGRVSNAVTVGYSRDNKDPFYTHFAYALQPYAVPGNPYAPGTAASFDLTRPVAWRPWIVGRSNVQTWLTAANAVNNVPCKVVIYRYREEPIHRLLWNLGNPGIATAADLALTDGHGTPIADLVAAGVY
jgi:hypothetical protein